MLVLGLLLIIGAALIAVGAIFDAGEEATVEVFGVNVTTTVAGVFVAGAATMLMLLLGVLALTSAMGRARRRRAQRNDARARQRDSVNRLEEERAALRAENERLSGQLADRPHDTTGATAAGATGAAAAGATATRAGGHDNAPAHDHAAHGTGHEDRSGASRLMDRMTGRSHPPAAHDISAQDPAHPQDPTATRAAATAPGGAPQSDRVVDRNSDSADRPAPETTSSGRHRDPL